MASETIANDRCARFNGSRSLIVEINLVQDKRLTVEK